MTQKKSYSRYFIILQEDEKGYALASDKLPSGYAKLELKNDKCKISYYVQNLKKESAPYYMILICGKKDVKKIIKLGELNIDEHGRCDVSYEYGVDSVGNSGINVDKVIGAGIVRFINSNIIPVMSGFASNEIPEWREYSIVEEEKQSQERIPEAEEVKQPEVEPEVKSEMREDTTNIFEEYEIKIEEIKEEQESEEEIPQRVEEAQQEEVQQEDVSEPNLEIDSEEARHKDKKKDKCEDKHKDNVSKVKEEKLENKCKDNVSKIKEEKHEDKCKDNECKIKEEKCEEEKSHKDNYKCDDHKEKVKGSVGGFFKDLVEDFEEVQDFASEIKRCSWYKVPVRRPEDMNNCVDYNKYTVVYYPMINHYQYIRRFGHFLMGYKQDKDNKMKYLVYGVPGTKSRTDQPFGGRTGFVTWVPLKDGDENEGSMGYWLMFYDFKNATIVIPVK